MEAFANETNFTVWSSLSNCLSKLTALFSHTALDKPLKNYGRKLFANITRRLGWDSEEKESHLDTLLRSLVLNKMISFEDPDTIKEAKSRYVLPSCLTLHLSLNTHPIAIVEGIKNLCVCVFNVVKITI